MEINNWLIVFVLVVSAVLLFWFTTRTDFEETEIESTLEILEKSYAKGDISIEDYLELKENLNQKAE
ncbi:hypothetical protein [uncultured Maribacter sp.]|uniref:hypothetical protein n=1 Tax=uncultured Maribacter sp. TaxID=431308 RepID=UPI0030DAFB61|tara:strand:+ start:7358 stop:7558 length:201 start_codon:yes stop_codon:yes gene_type:complete